MPNSQEDWEKRGYLRESGAERKKERGQFYWGSCTHRDRLQRENEEPPEKYMRPGRAIQASGSGKKPF